MYSSLGEALKDHAHREGVCWWTFGISNGKAQTKMSHDSHNQITTVISPGHDTHKAPRKSPWRLVSIPDGNFQKTAIRLGAIWTGIGPCE